MTIIDWEILNASEVPKWLVALSSKDEKRQLQAKMKLSTYLEQHALALNTASYAYNQVLETDAPVLITSLLIEMFKEESVAKPQYIAELLEIVTSYIREPKLGQAQKKRAERIYELVAQEYDLYLEMLEHTDSEVRVYIMNLLRQIPEKQEETASALIHHIEVNQISEDIEKLTAITMIFETIQAETHDIDLLRKNFIEVLNQLCENDRASAIVLARAACYLIALQGDQVSQTRVNGLVDILKEANFTDPSDDLGLSGLWIDTLLSRGPDQATQIFLDIFDHQTDEYALVEIGAVLLELHFGSGDVHYPHLLAFMLDENEVHILVSVAEGQKLEPTWQARGLSGIQKTILRQFIDKEQIWRIHTNLFELFSLPTSRSELGELIQQ